MTSGAGQSREPVPAKGGTLSGVGRAISEDARRAELAALQSVIDSEERIRKLRSDQRLRYLWLWASVALVALLSATVILSLNGIPSGLSFVALAATLVSTIMASLQIVEQRTRIADLQRNAAKSRAERRYLSAGTAVAESLVVKRHYREDAPTLVEQYRQFAKRNRRVHNLLQGVIIVGSIVTTSLTSAGIRAETFRWAAVATSIGVGVSAGFTGYFKFRERSFNQQQTADAIEKELNAATLGIERYSGKDEERTLTEFAERVEALREEQRKRELQLEQSSEKKDEENR